MLTAQATAAKPFNVACIQYMSWKIALNILYTGDVSRIISIFSQDVTCLDGDASVFTGPWILSWTGSAQLRYQCDVVFTQHLLGTCSPFSLDTGHLEEPLLFDLFFYEDYMVSCFYMRTVSCMNHICCFFFFYFNNIYKTTILDMYTRRSLR